MKKFAMFSAAALMALGLVLVSGSAYAQEMPALDIGGYVEAGFGQYTAGTADGYLTSTWDTQVQFTAKGEGVTGKVFYRNRPFSGETIYHEAAWTPTKGLDIKFGNMTIGETAAEVHRNGLEISQTVKSDPHGSAGSHTTLTTAVPNLQIRYQAGPVNVGLAIIDQACRPSCADSAGVSATNKTSVSDDQTMVILANGKFGPVGFEFANFTASGTADDGTTAIDGSAMHLGVKYSMGSTGTIRFDYASATAGGGDAFTNTSFSFDGFNTYFMYSTSDAGAVIWLQYYIRPGKGMTVYPEYVSFTPDGGDANTLIRLVAKKNF